MQRFLRLNKIDSRFASVYLFGFRAKQNRDLLCYAFVSCSGSASICREKSQKMLNVDLVFVDGLALLAFSGNMKTRYGP